MNKRFKSCLPKYLELEKSKPTDGGDDDDFIRFTQEANDYFAVVEESQTKDVNNSTTKSIQEDVRGTETPSIPNPFDPEDKVNDVLVPPIPGPAIETRSNASNDAGHPKEQLSPKNNRDMRRNKAGVLNRSTVDLTQIMLTSSPTSSPKGQPETPTNMMVSPRNKMFSRKTLLANVDWGVNSPKNNSTPSPRNRILNPDDISPSVRNNVASLLNQSKQVSEVNSLMEQRKSSTNQQVLPSLVRKGEIDWAEVAASDNNTVTLFVIHPSVNLSEKAETAERPDAGGLKPLSRNFLTFSTVHEAIQTACDISMTINVHIKVSRGQYFEEKNLKKIQRPNLWIEGERGVYMFVENLRIISPFVFFTTLYLQFKDLIVEQGRVSFTNVRFPAGHNIMTKFNTHEVTFDSCRFSKGKFSLGQHTSFKEATHTFRNCRITRCECSLSHCYVNYEFCLLDDCILTIVDNAELCVESTTFTGGSIDVRKYKKGANGPLFRRCNFDSSAVTAKRGTNLFSKCDFQNTNPETEKKENTTTPLSIPSPSGSPTVKN